MLNRLVLVAALLAMTAFDWVGKIELNADGLKSEDPEQRIEAVRKLGKSEVQWAKKHLLRALKDPDVRVRSAAGRVLARAKVVEAVPEIIRWLSGADKDAQQAAAEILGELGDARAIAPLVRSISDPDPLVRVRVVTALGKIGGDQVVVPLVNRLDDEKAEVRQAAVEQLMHVGDRRAVIPLVGLFNDSSPEVRHGAVLAVGRLGDRAALPALMRLLRDQNEQMKIDAVTALGNLQAHEATDTLIGLLGTGSENLRNKVAFSLGQIARASRAGGSGREALEALVEGTANGQLRAAAREALAAAGPVAVPTLVAHLEGKLDGDPATAVLLLRDLEDPRATPVLVAELGRGRLSRELVLEALGRLGDSRALVPVLGLLGDKDAAVRLAAMRALRPLLGKGSRAADVLGDMLDDKDLEIRVLAAEYLGIMKAEVAVPRLVALAGRGDEIRLRSAAITALGDIGHKDATATLVRILENGPASLQMAAASSLIYIQDPRAVEPLIRLIGKAMPAVKVTAARALGGVLRDRKNGPARRLLEELAAESRVELSLAAIAGLGAMGDPASAGTLIALARGGQLDRRRAAIEALGNLGNKGDHQALLEDQLRSTDDRIAGAAAWALGKLGASSARPALVRSSKRRGFATPINASAAFALLAEPADGKTLLDLLHHRSRLVRANAAAAAGRLALAAARPRLISLLARDASWLVRVGAARALSRIGGGKEALTKAAKHDTREEVRKAAEAALAGKFDIPARSDWREFYFVDPTSGDQPVEQEPYFIVGADGIVTALYTDARGQAVEERFPPGDAIIASGLEEKAY
jgi:HEAT repeat protein